jgi:hypothetical protein
MKLRFVSENFNCVREGVAMQGLQETVRTCHLSLTDSTTCLASGATNVLVYASHRRGHSTSPAALMSWFACG